MRHTYLSFIFLDLSSSEFLELYIRGIPYHHIESLYDTEHELWIEELTDIVYIEWVIGLELILSLRYEHALLSCLKELLEVLFERFFTTWCTSIVVLVSYILHLVFEVPHIEHILLSIFR